MHIKIASSDSWNLQTSLVHEIRTSSHGIVGADYARLLKQADEEFAHRAREIKIGKGQLPVHIVAMGSTEMYGCFVAGTPIALSDGSYAPVESLQVGQDVLSADGHICPVSALFRKAAPSTLRVDVCGLPDELVVTADHPFRVVRKESVVCDHDCHKRCLPPTYGKQNICNRPKVTRDCVLDGYRQLPWEWAEASSLRLGDFLVWTCPKIQPPIDLGADEGYLLGAWLAEGSFSRNASNNAVRAIALSMHKEEHEFLAKLKECAARLGLTLNDYVYEGGSSPNERHVTVSGNPDRFRIWHTLFNEYSLCKRVPPWVCCLPRATRLAVLAGYLDGDGSCVVDEKENRTTARSHGRDLSYGMQRLCWSLGFPAVCCRVQNTEAWNLSIANSYLPELETFSWKVRGRRLVQTTKVHGFYHDGRMYLPIRGVTANGSADVFNFEVAGDHTYSGPNVDSHNCNRNGDGFKIAMLRRCAPSFVKHAKFFRHHDNTKTSPYYGSIKLAHVNERMGRVELLCLLNETKEAAEMYGGRVADEEVRWLKSGKDLAGSMAISIPHDVCSACGNKAPTRKQYCKSAEEGGTCTLFGCVNGLTKISNDGHIQHVDNPDGTFFDYSKVRRPADRTAFGNVADYLCKCASEKRAAGGSELAELEMVFAPPDIALVGMLTERQKQHFKVAYELAEKERELQSRTFRADGIRPRTEIAWGTKRSQELAAASDVGILLSFTEFGRLNGWSDERIKESSEHVPGVFVRLASDGRLEETIRNNRYGYTGSDMATRDAFRSKFAADCALTPDAVRRRATLDMLDNQAPTVKVAAALPEADDSDAVAYAAYKIAHFADSKACTILTPFDVVFQNYACR